MTNFETAYEKVKVLVKQFKANEAVLMSDKYQETQVRTDYLDKFFSALGWDVRHKEQTNPREQEVQIESNSDSISNRKVDYAFYLAPDYQRPVFLVEAKKPKHNLDNQDYYFQTIRYGYNRSTSISVLTDFQEFHVIDCRRKPEKSAGIVKYAQKKKFTYEEYLDRQKFGEIYWLFSREAVEQGKLKEFWKGLPKPKGISKQLRLLAGDQLAPPDDEFLADLDLYREKLAKALYKTNPDLPPEELTASVQAVLDRLVFIRFLEDKLIEPDFIVDRFLDPGAAWQNFMAWSRKLDKKYNGIVFKPHYIDKAECNPPDDGIFLDICERLSHKESPYLLNYIPVEILGSIYERFLGKVIVQKGKSVAVEEKPEVRKAGGVYYTPKYIVDYIVTNTVGKILEGKTPKEIAKLRFADIACGSGSFLIAVFDHINRYLEEWYNAHPDEAKKDKCSRVEGNMWTLSLSQRRAILTNNIYGVDLDEQAVEVAQFSLFLKLLESESISSTETYQTELVQVADKRILPDLSKNILCGNSLVEYDIEQLFPLTPEDEHKIKPFDFKVSFKDIMSKGGFDAIVGNPPYVRSQMMEEGLKQYLVSHYEAASYQPDTFAFFLERAIGLNKNGGRVGYIIPNGILTNTYYAKLRKYILDNTALEILIDLKSGVFQKAAVDTSIVITRRGLNGENVNENVVCVDEQPAKSISNLTTPKNTIKQSSLLSFKDFTFNTSINESSLGLTSKLASETQPLESFCTIYAGMKVRKDFVSKSKENELYRPFLLGGDIHPYAINWRGNYVCYDKKLESKFSNQAFRDEEIFLSSVKLLVRQVMGKDRIYSVIDDSRYYADQSLYVLLPDKTDLNAKYILALVNSRLMSYFFQEHYGR